MADTFTPLLNIRLQQTGQNNNTWGELLNTDSLTALETAITDQRAETSTGGTLDISATPIVHNFLRLAGALVSDLTVIIPNKKKRMWVYNDTTGNFGVILKTAASTAVTIPRGKFVEIWSTGASGVLRADGERVGEIFWHGGTTAPNGSYECDGTTKSRTIDVSLFNVIGTTWGVGNGSTTFTLPDLKTAGRYLRSRTASVAVGTYQAEDVGPHSHANTCATSVTMNAITPAGTVSPSSYTPTGSVSTSISGQGAGLLSLQGAGFSAPATGSASFTLLSGSSSFSGNAQGFSFSGNAVTPTTASVSSVMTNVNNSGTENRPVTAVAMACIRY